MVTSWTDQPPTACGLGPSVRDLMSTDVVTVAPSATWWSMAAGSCSRRC